MDNQTHGDGVTRRGFLRASVLSASTLAMAGGSGIYAAGRRQD